MSSRDWLLEVSPHDNPLWPFLLPGVASALRFLRERGIEPGQRVGIVSANSPGFAALLQALPLLGATTVLINHRLHAEECRKQIGRLALNHELMHFPSEFSGASDLGAISPLADADPALVLFSSGSEGEPKAVRLSWRAVRFSADAAAAHLSWNKEQRWLACLPLDHVGGASIIYRAGRCGYDVHLVESFDTLTATRCLDGADGISVVPTMLHRLIAERGDRPWPASLRYVLTGGGPLSQTLIADCVKLGLAPLQTYGMSETASQVTTLTPEEAAVHAGSAGRPLPGMDVRIGEDDRIHVRGPQLFDGYEQGGKLVRRHAPGDWFVTNDLGSLNDGYLTVRGRMSDLIISGGEKIFPAEVEAVLAQHPAITEAAVLGVDDAEWGQRVVALLVARERPLADEALHDWLRDRLAGFKKPRQWTWIRALPRTSAGKLHRMKLRELL